MCINLEDKVKNEGRLFSSRLRGELKTVFRIENHRFQPLLIGCFLINGLLLSANMYV